MDTQFKYYAFISYSRKDEKYAKWIQDKLESYKLPSRIAHDNPELKKGIRPIFRDKTDLGAGSLYDNLGKELAVSQYLIIISSPSSATSDWVTKEIREFLKTHPADHIIPFIVSGTPNSNDENECFSSAIKEITPEILGVNIQEIGKQQALTKVVAKLLNLSFDALWQRHQRQEKRKKIILGICAILVVCIGLFLWDYNRPKYEYYTSIAEYANGWLPKGIIQLDKNQVQHRFNSYRFTYRQNKLQEVAVVNSHGRAVGKITKFVHPTRTSVKPLIQHYNLSRDILYTEEISGQNYDRIDFMYPPEKGGAAFGVRDKRNKVTDVRRHALTRNENGFVVGKDFKRYPGVDAVAASDAQGIFGYEYEVDSLGQILAQYYIDNTKKRVASKKGLACIRYTYDAMGNVIREQYLNNNGSPHFTNFGGAETRRIFDEYGNNINETYYNAAGERCIAPYYGYATFKTKYDEWGNKIEQSYYDTHGSLRFSTVHIALLTQKFDDEGNCIEIAYFDNNKRPTNDINEYAKVELKYDSQKGQVIEESYYGIDGKPCLRDLGYARVLRKYDERGYLIEESYYGIDDMPCLRDLGCAKIIQDYDEHGNVIEESYYGIDGKPCLRDLGYARVLRKYDERGNIIEELYFNTNSKLCVEYAKLLQKFDKLGRIIEQSSFNGNDRPCIGDWGYFRLLQNYDEYGNVIEESYLGIDGKPCLRDYGYARVTRNFDAEKNVLNETFWDIKNVRCMAKYTYARLPEIIDSQGFLAEERYVEIEQDNQSLKNGYSKFEGKYDSQTNRLIEVVYYDDKDNVLLVIHDPIVRRL